MKKLGIFLLILSMLFASLGCQNTDQSTAATSETVASSEVESTPSDSDATAETTTETAPATTTAPSGEVSQSGNVTITLPAEYFSEEENFDPDAFNAEQGFVSTVVNGDGSVSITMTAAQHEALLSDLRTNIDAAFSEMVGSDDTPYVKSITSSDGHYEYVVIKVDKAGYDETFFDMTPLMVSIASMTYQLYDNFDQHCVITVVDDDTGDVLNDFEYPEPVAEQ